MDTEIHKTPPVPAEITEAVNSRSLSVFVGAGASKLVGCPGWIELANEFVEICYKVGCINYRQREGLLQDGNPKKTVTICYHLLKNKGSEDTFFSTLEDCLEGDKHLLQSRNIYRELAQIPATYVTTNVDRLFDRFFSPERIAYRVKDFISSSVQERLYHIHGSVEDRGSLVFTVPQYISRYRNSDFIRFLQKIFSEHIVLFIGYGMEEFELLDFLIQKFDPQKDQELKHFILRPYFRGEEDVLGFDRFYFNSMGIRPIGYEKDEKGYTQLYDVIQNWKDEIKQTSAFLHEDAREIDYVVDNL